MELMLIQVTYFACGSLVMDGRATASSFRGARPPVAGVVLDPGSARAVNGHHLLLARAETTPWLAAASTRGTASHAPGVGHERV